MEKKENKTDKLTPKQRLFAEIYIENGYNASNAYLAAYGTNSKDIARKNAWKVLKNEKVKDYICELQKELFSASAITAERLANKLSEIAFADKDDDKYNATAQLKAIDLLQKQFNLQKQTIQTENITLDISIDLDEQDAD